MAGQQDQGGKQGGQQNSRSPVRAGSKVTNRTIRVVSKAVSRNQAKAVSRAAKVGSKAGSKNQDKAASRVAKAANRGQSLVRKQGSGRVAAGFVSGGSMPRQLIEPKSDKRFVRRKKTGQFKESDDVGRSLSQDPKRKAKTSSKKAKVTVATERKRKSVK